MTEKALHRYETWLRICRALLIVGSVLATIKVIFVDFTLDEEYQIVMAYRNLSGDTLFGTMWEPHQTSAFACVLLMRLFYQMTGGTTGVVLFLRVVTALIQFGLSWWLVKVLRKLIGEEYAFYLGICYFNMIPKIIQIPEFSNLQLWFFTVTTLSLMEYKMAADAGRTVRGKWRLIAAGIGMSLMVLAYPSSLILFPFFLIIIWKGRTGKADPFLFALTCAVCAGVWLAAVLTQVSWEEFWRNLHYIPEFDLTHDVSPAAEYRISTIAGGLGELILPIFVTVILAFTGWKLASLRTDKKGSASGADTGRERAVFAVFLALAAELVQLFYWIVLQRGYEEPQIHVLTLFGAALLVRSGAKGQKEPELQKEPDRQMQSDRSQILVAGILGGMLSIAAAVYMSDLDAWYAVPHGMLGALLAAAFLVCVLESRLQEKSRVWIRLLLIPLAICAIFGKGFTLRAGTTDTNTICGIRGVIRKGPAAGIFTNYMQAYITNCTYEDFEKYVKEGENCLVVTNMVGSAGTSPYMFRNLAVSHFSIVDPTSYDERLLAYWELYPEKKPDVIVVDCWYGGLIEPEDSWIMQYIEREFDYSDVQDGRYVRFYRK